MFESSGATTDRFFARVIMGPSFLAFAYAIAVAAQGASWWWLLIAIGGAVGSVLACVKCLWVQMWENVPNAEYEKVAKWKRWGLILLCEGGETVGVICWTAIWVRLVIISSVYGLYESVWVHLNSFGIVAALLSLVLGWLFSKQFNASFFFVAQYTRRRQFRGGTRVEA